MKGTRESHPRVHDLQHPRLGKPRRGLQIMDTRMGFPCPFHSVVIDSISLTKNLLLSHYVYVVHVSFGSSMIFDLIIFKIGYFVKTAIMLKFGIFNHKLLILCKIKFTQFLTK